MQIMRRYILINFKSEGGVRSEASTKASTKCGTPPPTMPLVMLGVENDDRKENGTHVINGEGCPGKAMVNYE